MYHKLLYLVNVESPAFRWEGQQELQFGNLFADAWQEMNSQAARSSPASCPPLFGFKCVASAVDMVMELPSANRQQRFLDTQPDIT